MGGRHRNTSGATWCGTVRVIAIRGIVAAAAPATAGGRVAILGQA
jgi:hypothetical protein